MQNMLEKLIGESKVLERAIAGEDLNAQDGIELMKSDDHYMIGAVADATRKKLVGDKVTFTASSYLNYTNVCAASCQICAFYRKENDNDAYTCLLDSNTEQDIVYCMTKFYINQFKTNSLTIK